MQDDHSLHDVNMQVRDLKAFIRSALPQNVRDEIEQRDDRWPHWGVFPDEACAVPIVDEFTESALLTQMAEALIEDHPGAFQGIVDPPWRYGWFPASGRSRCWLLKPSERLIAINSIEAAGAMLTNRQVRVQLHNGMIHAEHRINRILDRMAQPRRKKGATNLQMRLVREGNDD